jgi:hypothetical protein
VKEDEPLLSTSTKSLNKSELAEILLAKINKEAEGKESLVKLFRSKAPARIYSFAKL